jgi:hypothetical protein
LESARNEGEKSVSPKRGFRIAIRIISRNIWGSFFIRPFPDQFLSKKYNKRMVGG